MPDKQQQHGELAQKRHKSRELALCTLYAYEVDNGCDWKQMLEEIADNGMMDTEVRKYALKLLGLAIENLANIDPIIAVKAVNWEMRRMAAVDRNVLRLAVTELIYLKDTVPYKVVIDEAVEIAKVYGTNDSGKFVKGILDSIRKSMAAKPLTAEHGGESSDSGEEKKEKQDCC